MVNDTQAEYLILILYTVALSDNDFHGKELEYIKSIGTQYGISEDRINFILTNPHKIFQAEPESEEQRLLFAYSMCEILYSDGKIDPREVNSIRKFMELLEIKEIDELSSMMIDSVIAKVPFDAFLTS